jgi:cytoskeletal protein RodZ
MQVTLTMKVRNMEKTEDLEIDIDDIGTILKSSRLKSKKTLEDISSELCIRKIYLTALEEGDYETLPPIPYGVGYVRTYARYLGLNPERAVKLYKSASIVEEQKEEQEEVAPEVVKVNNKHVVVSVLVLLLVYGFWQLLSSKKTEETPVVENVAEVIVEEKNDSSSVVYIETEIQTESEVVVEDKIVETDTTVENEVEVVEPKDNVVIEFLGESWVELKGKNKVYFQGVFHKGDKKEIDYIENLFISVGRPYNVKVLVKGVEKNIVAKRRKMNIPLDSL